MKTIELKKEKEIVVVNNKELEMDMYTYELLESVINSPLKEGFTTSEMASRLKLLDVIKQNKDQKSFNLEDSDFNYLGGLVKNMKWAIISRFILDFAKQFD